MPHTLPVKWKIYWFSLSGYRETAFSYAVSAAGVSHSVARACSQGRLLSCGCDPISNRKGLSKSIRESLEKEKRVFLNSIENPNEMFDRNHDRMNGIETNEVLSKKKMKLKLANRWKWGGCSHNMDFGVEFSEMFLDSREKAGDIQSQINLHNNKVGRLVTLSYIDRLNSATNKISFQAVKNHMQVQCKCHGMSGSCQLKTCWKAAPEFRTVGKVLKQQFRRAVLVDQSNLGNEMIIYKKPKKRKSTRHRPARPIQSNKGAGDWKKKKKNRLENSLFYYQRSPNFCERDQTSDILGKYYVKDQSLRIK